MKASVKVMIGVVALLMAAAIIWSVAFGMSELLPRLMSISRKRVYMLQATSALLIAAMALVGIRRKLKKAEHA